MAYDDDADCFERFALAEYAHVADSLLRNEEDGERRATFFLTITTALAGGAGAVVVRGELSPGASREHAVVLGAALLALGVGWFTYLRILARNEATDRYKVALRELRQYFVTRATAERYPHAFFGVHAEPVPRRTSLLPVRSGWLEIVAGVNSALAGTVTALLVARPDGWPTVLGAAAGVGAGLAAWATQIHHARCRYHALWRGLAPSLTLRPPAGFGTWAAARARLAGARAPTGLSG